MLLTACREAHKARTLTIDTGQCSTGGAEGEGGGQGWHQIQAPHTAHHAGSPVSVKLSATTSYESSEAQKRAPPLPRLLAAKSCRQNQTNTCRHTQLSSRRVHIAALPSGGRCRHAALGLAGQQHTLEARQVCMRAVGRRAGTCGCYNEQQHVWGERAVHACCPGASMFAVPFEVSAKQPCHAQVQT